MHVPSRSLVSAARSRPPSPRGLVTPWPLTTVFLLVVMVVVFGIEVRLAAPGEEKALSPLIQILLGGLTGPLARAGQWDRLLSYAFLHANAGNLVSNAIVLGFAGHALERIVGHAWMFCIFAMGALCGGLASLLMLPPATVTVGASGAIMAVVWALVMTSFRLPRGRARGRAQMRSICIGLPGIIPHQAVGPMQVNHSAPIGGAILGVVVGLLLLKGWDDHASRPPCIVGAGQMSALAALAFRCSAYAASVSYRSYGPASRFIPPDLIPRQPVDIKARGGGLAASFPMDARSHLYAGTADLARNDLPGAQDEFGRALELDAAAPGLYPPGLANTVHLLLAVLLFADGHRRDAVAMAQPFCRQPHPTYPTPGLQALVSRGPALPPDLQWPTDPSRPLAGRRRTGSLVPPRTWIGLPDSVPTGLLPHGPVRATSPAWRPVPRSRRPSSSASRRRTSTTWRTRAASTSLAGWCGRSAMRSSARCRSGATAPAPARCSAPASWPSWPR